jgi:hypothetical protein
MTSQVSPWCTKPTWAAAWGTRSLAKHDLPACCRRTRRNRQGSGQRQFAARPESPPGFLAAGHLDHRCQRLGDAYTFDRGMSWTLEIEITASAGTAASLRFELPTLAALTRQSPGQVADRTRTCDHKREPTRWRARPRIAESGLLEPDRRGPLDCAQGRRPARRLTTTISSSTDRPSR